MSAPILDWHYNDQFPLSKIATTLGDLPTYIFRNDMRTIEMQLAERSNTFEPQPSGFSFTADEFLVADGHGILPPVAFATHLNESIFAFEKNLITIVQQNGDFSVARVI